MMNIHRVTFMMPTGTTMQKAIMTAMGIFMPLTTTIMITGIMRDTLTLTDTTMKTITEMRDRHA